MSVTAGYTRDARDPGPQMFPRVVSPNLSQADTLLAQARMASDPARAQELMYLAALEKKFAMKTAQAQQGVQDALLTTNPLKKGDFILGSPWQSVAKMERGRLRDQAAQEYNAGLPASYMGSRKPIGSQFYGA